MVFKSPGNTARVSELLEIYPDARFIHIVRDPKKVIPSTFHLYESILPEFSLQDETTVDLNSYIYDYYQSIMHKYLNSKSSIGNNQLCEVKFEEFTANPMQTINSALGQLNIECQTEPLLPFFEARKNFKKNTFSNAPERSNEINIHCKEVIEAYQYFS